ncbi:MAG: magnesium transporter [Acholeplasmataceae bacterium]
MKTKINFKHSDESIKKALLHIHPYDVAILYSSFNEKEKSRILPLMASDLLVDFFVELDEEHQINTFEMLPITKQKFLLRKLETDELKAFIQLFDEDQRAQIISKLSKVRAKTIELLLQYDEDDAASIMMTDYFVIPVDLTIKQATTLVITESKDSDYIDTVFIQDEEEKCIGYMDLKDLIIARPNQKLENIMITDFSYVHANDSIEQAIQKVLDYNRNVIPVLDETSHMIGIITADDIFDEMIEDYQDDYDSFSQVFDHDISLNPLKRSKQRVPWLFLGVILNLLTITILATFSNTIEQVTVLILFQPMILGMAGNIGTQALAVTILGIHQQDYKEHYKAKKHILKEMAIGLTNSLLLGIIAFIFVYIYLSIIQVSNQLPVEVALTVFIALFSAMLVSSTIGSIVPIVFDKIGIDPATASGPMMTTINDILSLVIYFTIATIIFI